MSHRPRVFYGWWVVATASLGMCFSTGTIVVLSFGVFFKPLSQYFHAGRAAVSLAFTLHGLVGAACVPLIGRLIDRFGARRVILTGTTIFGLVLLSSGLVGASITYLYLFYVALGLVSGTTSPVPYGVVVSRWFDRQRGLALGLMAFGLGLGAIAMPLVAQRLIAMFGWRATYATFGCAALLLSLPVVAAFLAEDPRQKGMWPDGIAPTQSAEQDKRHYEGLSWRDTWHQPTFWLLICAFFLAGASLFACVLHMPALLTDRGVSAQGAAVASSVVGVALLIGRIGAGYLLDRIFAPRLAMLLFGGSAVGIALLSAGSMGKLALVAAFLVGVGMGAEVDIIAYLMSRYFGLRALGTAFGYGFGSYAFAGALGVLLMGAGFDLTHSYTVPLAGFFIAMVLAAGLMTRLGPYRYAAQQAGELPPVVKVHVGSHA
jgi:MFS family permease